MLKRCSTFHAMGLLLRLFLLCYSMAPVLHAQFESITFEFSKVITTQNDPRERAVAFHSLTFINELALPIGELIFGTPEAISAQGEGWFNNEVWPDVGPFQWAGGNDKKATLTVQVPPHTEGMLVRINAAVDSLWVTVRIGTNIAAQFRVDSYWRSSYIPIGEAVPVEKPTSVPVWTQGMYFPAFPQTDRVYVLRVATRMHISEFSWQSSFRIDNSYEDMMTLSLISMQGVINRHKPSVYIEWGGYEGSLWRSEMAKHVDTVYLQLDGLTAINFLMRKFGDWFSGAVVYDPEVGETINLATMYAGLEDRVMLAPVQVSLPGMPSFNSSLDLRPMAAQHSWDTTEAGRLRLYQWVYDNLWPDIEKRILGVISPGPPTSGRVDNGYFPLSLAGRDYLIALKLSALSLDPIIPEQAALLSKFLTDAPSPIPVTGAIGLREHPMVDLITRHGDWLAVMHWPGELFSCANMTVFSGLPTQPARYEPNFHEDRIIASLKSKSVATLFTTDGDAFFYLYNHGFRGNIGWEDARSQRLGWSLNPVLANLAPLLWNNYVQTRSGSGLISAVSGAGYIFPWLMDDNQIADYLAYTNTYLKMTGLRVVHIFEGLTTYFWSEVYGRKYAEALRDAGYLGSILGYGHNEWRGLGFYYTGTPAPTARTAYLLNSTTLDAVVEDLASRKPGEEFYDITDKYYISPEVRYVADQEAFGGAALHVPREFLNSPSYSLVVYIGPMSLAPGQYKVSVRMKVAQNVSSGTIARVKMLYRGPNPPAWVNNLPILEVSANDFQAANKYQDFTWRFTVDSLVTELWYWFEYGDGATELWLDYAHSVNQDGAELPVTGTIVINNSNPFDRDLRTTPTRFAEAFAARGGLTLTPDEFIASLNPEIMLDLAKKYIGTNPDIVDAEQLLSEGKYLQSLLASRRALKVVPTGITHQEGPLPLEFRLYHSYPNPFNPSTTIKFDLPFEEDVTLTVMNVLGQEVQSLIEKRLTAGTHTVTWDASGFSSGVYFYRLSAGELTETKRLILLR